MIEFRSGDILIASTEALVNTVNCVGIMGRGIALQFKNAYPANFKAYAAACKQHEVQPGRMFVHELRDLTGPRWIINFPTKRHWKGKSRIEDIDAGLIALVDEVRSRNIRSIAIPPLGSGLGGLHWPDVRERIEDALGSFSDLQVLVYEPGGAPDPKVMARTTAAPSMSNGRAALVLLMERYLRGLMDPFVTLLEVQKLMYFMQAAGQQLRLRYVQHHYGPYAENLRHVLHQVEGHLISGYGDGGDAPDKHLELVPGAMEEAEAFLQDDPETRARFDRVADLVDGFETPFGLELLSTVHWIADRGARTGEEAIEGTYAWNERKRQFSPSQILLAWQVLAEKQWISSGNTLQA